MFRGLKQCLQDELLRVLALSFRCSNCRIELKIQGCHEDNELMPRICLKQCEADHARSACVWQQWVIALMTRTRPGGSWQFPHILRLLENLIAGRSFKNADLYLPRPM